MYGYLKSFLQPLLKECVGLRRDQHLVGQSQKASKDKKNPQSHYYQINANSNHLLDIALLLGHEKLKGFRPSNADRVQRNRHSESLSEMG